MLGGVLQRGLDRIWFSTPAAALRAAMADSVDLLAPMWCVGCRAAGVDLCDECRADVRLLTSRPFRAEDPAEALPIIGADSSGIHVLPVVSASRYSTLMADVLLAYKDHERARLNRVLAPALSRAISAAVQSLFPHDGLFPQAGLVPGDRGSSGDILLLWPPPSLRSRLRRGWHPLGELVSDLVLPSHVIPAGGMLQATKGTAGLLTPQRGQKGRSAGARRTAGVQIRPGPGAAQRLDGADVLLVDDVLTTGATLRGLYELADGLGAHVHGAAVLTATPRGPH